MDNCRRCKFFYVGSLPDRGECHRYAPKLVTADMGGSQFFDRTIWPFVMADSGCGEFQQVQEEPGAAG